MPYPKIFCVTNIFTVHIVTRRPSNFGNLLTSLLIFKLINISDRKNWKHAIKNTNVVLLSIWDNWNTVSIESFQSHYNFLIITINKSTFIQIQIFQHRKLFYVSNIMKIRIFEYTFILFSYFSQFQTFSQTHKNPLSTCNMQRH